MKLFEERQIKEAFAYSAEGGQALHLFSNPGVYPGAPICFKRNLFAAHLFDDHIERLKLTASKLGVKRIVISRVGRQGQHVDLCGRPLQKAIALCSKHADTKVA
jgi:hypothetical protein